MIAKNRASSRRRVISCAAWTLSALAAASACAAQSNAAPSGHPTQELTGTLTTGELQLNLSAPAPEAGLWLGFANVHIQPEPSDLDVFATLLSDAVREAYRWPEAVRAAHPQWGDIDASMISARVAQLPAQGLVVLVDAPPMSESAATENAVEEPPAGAVPDDSWERTRQRLMGHDTPPAKATDRQCRGCHASNEGTADSTAAARWPTRERLVEAISRVVAEHGHRVSELAPGERLWVSVDFARPAAATLSIQPYASSLTSAMTSGPNAGTWRYTVTRPGPANPPRQQSSEETAADLHMRQGNYAKAAELYRQAIETGRRDADVYANLLKSYLAMGDAAQAQQALEQWKAAQPLAGGESPTPASTPAARQLVVEFKQPTIAAVAKGEIDLMTFQRDALAGAHVVREAPRQAPKP